MLFERPRWVNHPRSTYFAEHKPLQLRRAHLLGFDVPRTRVSNSASSIHEVAGGDTRIVAKGLDTILLREPDREIFGFTQFHQVSALREGELRSAPVIFQEVLQEKLDLRVTVVGNTAFAVEITRHGKPINGDWRCASKEAEYRPVKLPEDVEQRCVKLVNSLDLCFGAIDLAQQHDRYYFLEINPTGEWAWLVDAAGLPVDKAVAELLVAAP
jgi:glutathione synthase/RimK-type ligase-like ATP-grasp enzyme